MKNISNQEWFNTEATQAVIARFNFHGQDVARFVGGCVRNSLMGINIKDIDIATKMLPEEVISLFEQNVVSGITVYDRGSGIPAKIHTEKFTVIPTGLAHGTVTVMYNHVPFEITTLRKDVETDGRHAEVEFVTNWKEDAARRDFRMNALYADFNGNVYDYFGGVEDIENGEVVFVGNPEDRIQEDYLRILRFFRFSTYYGKKWMNDEGVDACAKHAEGLKQISAERISAELIKILEHPHCRFTIAKMVRRGIIEYVVPNFKSNDLLGGLYAQEFFSGHPEADALLRLRSMLPNDGERIRDTANALRLSNDQKRRLVASVITDGKAIVSWNMRDVRKAVYTLGKQAYVDQYLLLWAMRANKKAGTKVLDYVQSWEIPSMPVSGDDLIAAGVKEGKDIGRNLKMIEQKWIDSDFTSTKTELMEGIKNESKD